MTALRSVGDGPGSVPQDGCHHPGVRRAPFRESQAQQLQAAPILLQQGRAIDRIHDCRVLQHHRQVIGLLASGIDQETGPAIPLLERGQHLSASAGVPIGPVREVQAVLAIQVEDIDVMDLYRSQI